MKKIINAIKTFFTNPKYVFLLGLFVALLATTIEVIRGRNTNYFDYQDATRMFWEGISPYTLEFVQAHCIHFLYLPVFCVIFAPIFLLPWWLGPFVWNIGNYCLFALAIKTLPQQLAPYRMKIFLFLLPVLLQGVFCYQYNLVVCYIFLFAFTLLERNKPLWAILIIMISATTKIYGLVELALLLCYPKVWRNYAFAILCGIILLALPALNPHFSNPFSLYEDTVYMIANHQTIGDYSGLLFARGLKPLFLPNYRIVQLTVIAILSLLFFWRHQRWESFTFRVNVLAVVMGYVILFSDSPETHTYLIALSGYLMAFWLHPNRTKFDWIIFWLLFVNFGILPTDVLCPTWLYRLIHDNLWLDVYCMAIAWIRVIWWAVGPLTEGLKPISKTATIVVLLLCVTSLHAQDKRFVVNGVPFVMKQVKGGTFTMGAKPGDKEAYDDEVNYKVHVKDYYIGETEVTQALWEAVMGKNRSKKKGAQHPAEYIHYDMCLEFISKLNKLTGEHFRLPTEAEWEFAAKGGLKSKGYLYAGSNNINEVAYSQANLKEVTHQPVAQLKPNELGLYDMSGNVWEWCADRYRKNPQDKASNSFYVIRGGAYNSLPKFCRNSNRYMYDQRRRRDLLGLRLAL